MAIDMGGLAFGRTGGSAGCTLACARDVRRKRNEILTPPLLVLQSGGRVRNDPPLSEGPCPALGHGRVMSPSAVSSGVGAVTTQQSSMLIDSNTAGTSTSAS
jgi:hypothetical protein